MKTGVAARALVGDVTHEGTIALDRKSITSLRDHPARTGRGRPVKGKQADELKGMNALPRREDAGAAAHILVVTTRVVPRMLTADSHAGG